MPILKSAKKKLKADKKKKLVNRIVRTKASRLLDKAKTEKTAESLSQAFSALDRAAKKGVFHHRKADRLKSRLAKLFGIAK